MTYWWVKYTRGGLPYEKLGGACRKNLEIMAEIDSENYLL